MNPKEVGSKIRFIRKNKLGLSMSDFARLIDDKAQSGTVSNWETGKNLPNNERLKKIAEIGNITISQLLGEERDMTNEVLEIDESIKNLSLKLKERDYYLYPSYDDPATYYLRKEGTTLNIEVSVYDLHKLNATLNDLMEIKIDELNRYYNNLTYENK